MFVFTNRLGFCGSAAFLLDTNLIQDESQAGNGSQEGAKHLCHQSILAGQFTEAAELFTSQHGAFDNATLDGQGELVLLGELAYDTSRSNGVAGRDGHSGSAVEDLIEVVAVILGCETGQIVLNNGLFHFSFTELLTQSGVLCNIDTLVVNENHGRSFLDLVAQDTALRKQFREAEVEYTVVKNTLTRFAAKNNGYDFDEVLNGTTAMAITTGDPIAPARIVCEFAKKNKLPLTIKGGIVEGSVLTGAQLSGFGELPSKNALVAQVLGTFLAPISSLAFVLDQIRIQKDPNAAPAAEAEA